VVKMNQMNQMNLTLYQKRYELFQQLYELWPYIRFQAQNKARFTPYFSFLELKEHFYAPAIHYSILPNEIVIEIDSIDDDNFVNAIDFLKLLDIPFIFGFSGNKSWHIHLLAKSPKASVQQFIEHPNCQHFCFVLFQCLIKMMRNKGIVGIDEQPMKHRRIRSFYSQHVATGWFKLPIAITPYRPYPIWEVPSFWYYLAKQEIEKLSLSSCRISHSKDKEGDALAKALQLLERFKARETSTYIYYHCPFHQPDRHPSFTFNKQKQMFTDWHDGKRYTAKQLLDHF